MEAEPTVCPICGVVLTEQDTAPCSTQECPLAGGTVTEQATATQAAAT